MNDSANCAKIVEWSDEDQCCVGSATGLVYGGCHGVDKKKVFDQLCRIVEEEILLYRRDAKPLPPPTSGRDFANKMQAVTSRPSGRESSDQFAHCRPDSIACCECGVGRATCSVPLAVAADGASLRRRTGKRSSIYRALSTLCSIQHA